MPSARSRLGARGESIAREHLERNGYGVLATNFRCQWGEIDIVARTQDCLVFVEVRTRRTASYGTPEESLSDRKRVRLIATAEAYLQSHPESPEEWRIDLISVRMGEAGVLPRIDHIENAIELG